MTEINRQNETDSLGTERIGKLLFRLSMPAIAAQLVNLLYNVVDRMYIGHIEWRWDLRRLLCRVQRV